MLNRNLVCLVGTATVIVANLVYTKVLLADEGAQTTTLSTTFACGMSQQRGPATIAHAPRGDVPIILWVSKYFEKAGFDPQSRCQVVSARFQTLYSRGNFNYIAAGMVNNQPVICATKGEKDPCTNDNTLFTLEPNDDPSELVKQLQETRAGAAGPITRGRETIDVEDFLANAPAEPRDSASSTTTAPITNDPPTQPAPRGRIW